MHRGSSRGAPVSIHLVVSGAEKEEDPVEDEPDAHAEEEVRAEGLLAHGLERAYAALVAGPPGLDGLSLIGAGQEEGEGDQQA